MDDQCDARVQRLATPKDCSIFQRNALKRGRTDLAQQAQQRWIALSAAEHIDVDDDPDPVRRELWEALSAHEYVAGHSITRARQAIRRRGLVAAADQIACKGEPSAGLAALDGVGLLAYAWEHVVLRHPDTFSAAAATSSRERIDAYEQQKAEAEVA